jgi:glycosyltransferase involved in cell wall biosynthesis
MRRWRDWQCRHTDLFVTPSAEILPPWVAPDRVLEIEWGADTKRFTPDAAGDLPFQRGPGETVVVFAGAFRPWHGAINLVHAIAQLRARGRSDVKVVFVGDGPELPQVRRAASGLDGIEFTGRIPHDRMPACLAAADIGVAPFDTAAHGPLQIAFYWSPLKLFEYMASGLPVVTPDIPRLRTLFRHEREGLCYDPEDTAGLADAIVRLADAPNRREMGRAARERVVREFGWDLHCRRLSEALGRAHDVMTGAEASGGARQANASR